MCKKWLITVFTMFCMLMVMVLAGAAPTPANYPDTAQEADIITKVPWVDVRAFGARGDNQTDDAAALQAAIDACTEGSTVFIPPGTFKCSKQLVINKAITLKGLGADTNGRTTINFPITNLSAGILITHSSVVLEGFYLKGNSASANSGIEVVGTPSSFVSFTRIKNVWSVGFLNGFYTDYAYLTAFEDCVGASNVKNGFSINHGATTTSIRGTWALNNSGNGYDINTADYMAFMTTAADNNKGYAYSFSNVHGVSINGIGSENNSSGAVYAKDSSLAINGMVGVGNGATATNATMLYSVNSHITAYGVDECSVYASAGVPSIVIDATSSLVLNCPNLQRSYSFMAGANISGMLRDGTELHTLKK
ncbi:hypothetical protein Ga0466249_000154 [Sporomusaceae bacterium BoRhaA]|uniref:glycosyl hydrolase family 28-related protein n=1 Tax=Pelorhabdus rhamnosifermentans TaxID=2772457 RepID=UPI001C062349|nr:glycosyl hydrolase family 28-related protein [Pelorhabdus rhamnosifermentans]MBU2699075.1 hypothetical protein [Pelorhabdus rhamnosifermentans]